MTHELLAICDACKKPVADGEGSLWVDMSEVDHVACDPAPNAKTYAIEDHRCRSWADLVLWTAHLMGKAWLSDTDWEDLLEAA